MNHLEAQSYIMPFIEGKIPDNKQEEFVIHMKNCKKCHDELEIYYTLIVGMRQLDNKKELSTDFSADLERDLRNMSHKIRHRRSFKISAFSVFMVAALIFCIIFYTGAIKRVYLFEQSTKMENQGDYYFSSVLHDKIIYDEVDRINTDEVIEKSKEISDFDRIRGFKKMENAYEDLINVGEDLMNVEITTD